MPADGFPTNLPQDRAPKDSGFRSLAEFYPFYLSEHRHPVSRALHYVGTWGSVLCLLALLATGNLWWLLGALFCGYSFAWLGHFFVRAQPAGDLPSSALQPRRRFPHVVGTELGQTQVS